MCDFSLFRYWKIEWHSKINSCYVEKNMKSLEFTDRCWGLSHCDFKQWHKYKENSIKLGAPLTRLMPGRPEAEVCHVGSYPLRPTGRLSVKTCGCCPACGLWMHKVTNIGDPSPLLTGEKSGPGKKYVFLLPPFLLNCVLVWSRGYASGSGRRAQGWEKEKERWGWE